MPALALPLKLLQTLTAILSLTLPTPSLNPTDIVCVETALQAAACAGHLNLVKRLVEVAGL